MANTVSILSYANTFGDWVVTTNALLRENNDFAANNYTKPTGTLYLNAPVLGLQVANNAVIAGQLLVEGVGSSATIQNNLAVGQQAYLTNTALSLVTSGQANVGGLLLVKGSGTGLLVSNNATISGTLTVTGQSNLNGITYVNNNLNVSGFTTLSNTVSITGETTISNNAIVVGSANVSQFLYVTRTVYANNVSLLSQVTANTIIANTRMSTIMSNAENFYANTAIQTPILVVTDTQYIDTIRANTSISVPTSNVSVRLDANTASGYFNTLQTSGQFTVGGNFVINGATVYSTNTFTLNAGSSIALPSAYVVNRGTTGANATIRWNEGSVYWDINDVATGTFYRILTTQQLNDTVTSTSTILPATANAANTLNNTIINVRAFAQSAYDSANNVGPQVAPAFNKANTANVTAQAGFDKANSANVVAQAGFDKANSANVLAQSAYNKANTGSGTFNGTTGQAISSNGVITFTSTNGVTITGTSNTLTINTPQNVAIGAAATLAGTNFSSIPNSALSNSSITVNGTSISLGGTGTATANAQTLTSTVLNPTVVTSSLTSVGTISSGTWSASFGAVSGANLTNLTAGNLSGTIPTGVLGNSALYVGTTSIALNRSSASQTLSGISIDGNAGTVTNGVYTSGSYSDPSWITSLAGSKISGDISGGAGSVAWGNVSSKPSLVYNDGGTYGINISGSAGYASSAGSASTAGNITAYTINQNVGSSNSPTFTAVYAGAFYYTSDKTLKKNIHSLTSDVVDQLIPVSFEWLKTGNSDDGFIAQEVQKVLPSAVSSSKEGTLSINPLPIVSHLTHKVQKQQEEINQLKEQVQFLLSKIGN